MAYRDIGMEHEQHNAIVNFIWGIADDVLRDVYVRGKYRDVILPMTVIHRLDALLEPSKEAVLKMKERLDKAKITQQEPALRKASGYPFYNTSTLRRLMDNPKQLKQNFEDYLDGFSPNVDEAAMNGFPSSQMFGSIDWKTTDKITDVVAHEIPAKVSADKACRNARQNSDKQNARIEHDRALERVITDLVLDHAELFKRFMEDPNFKKWLSDIDFQRTYDKKAA
jgi:type I restriction-modification system DNA methylase subunit